MEITKKQILGTLAVSLALFTSFLMPFSVRADENLQDTQIGLTEIGHEFGGSSTTSDVRTLVGTLINVALGFLGIIFVGLAIFAGFKYMTAAGNSKQTEEALSMLKNAIIGLIIVLAAWAITRFSIVMLNRAVRNQSTNIYPQSGL